MVKASKNVTKTKAKPKVKKCTKKMSPPPSNNKKKQKSHQLKGLDVWTDVKTENINVNKWLRTYYYYLQQELTIQKHNYFFGDDGVREKITKNMFFDSNNLS